MSSMIETPTDPRRGQLEELLSRLPPDKAEKLRETLCSQAGGQPISPMLADIIQRIALRAGDGGEDQPNALMRRVCVLFEPYLVSSPDDSEWMIQRASLMPWWKAAMASSADLRRNEERFIESIRARQPAAVERAVVESYGHLAEISPVLVLHDPSDALRRDMRKMTVLLKGRTALGAALAAIGIGGPVKPGREIEIDATLITGFVAQYVSMLREAAIDPVWLGHGVMNRLARPWTGIRLVRAVLDRGGLTGAARGGLEPLARRAFWHLSELGRAAEVSLRRAAKIRRVAEITQAAVAVERYFAAFDSVAHEAELNREHLAVRDAVIVGVSNTLGLFEGVVAGFLRHWQPRPEAAPDLAEALDAAALLGMIGAITAGQAESPVVAAAAAAIARLAVLLRQTPAAAAGSARAEWSVQSGRLTSNLRLELT
ncbi:MAG: hypothetical protein QOJ54_2913 [Aliidongia sp.]|nr:hypothetical protein [Aliidongia sp.]